MVCSVLEYFSGVPEGLRWRCDIGSYVVCRGVGGL